MTVPAKDPSRYVETIIDDETVVMVLDSGSFFSLRETAGVVWALIDGERDREAILARLEGEYDAPREQLAADLDAFLGELRQAGLLAAG
jgi:pyrroloquinoline quinone biosynthesis protein D